MDYEESLFLSAAALQMMTLVLMLRKKNDEPGVRKRPKTRTWSRKWLTRRHQGTGILSMLDSELKNEDPMAYRNFLRLSSAQFDFLLNLIEADIRKQETFMREPVTARQRLEVTLRFLATGESFRSLMYSTRIHESTISRFVPEVCDAIIEKLKPQYLKTPCTVEAWTKISTDFSNIWQFPHCLGAVDGKHINFVAPISDGSYYYNYKGTNSIVLLGMADAHYRFTYVNIGVNGRISDGGVFQSCSLSKVMQNNGLNFPPPEPLPGRVSAVPYVIVADDAFPLSEHLLKPYPQRNLDHDCRIYNYRLSRARRIIENAFGILVNRFRILLNTINLSPSKVEKITLTCVVLHNFLATENNNHYTEVPDENNIQLKGMGQQGGNRSSHAARENREEFKQYFNSPEGIVDWQENSIRTFNM